MRPNVKNAPLKEREAKRHSHIKSNMPSVAAGAVLGTLRGGHAPRHGVGVGQAYWLVALTFKYLWEVPEKGKNYSMFVLFKTALLICKSHTIKFTLLKYTIQWFSV